MPVSLPVLFARSRVPVVNIKEKFPAGPDGNNPGVFARFDGRQKIISKERKPLTRSGIGEHLAFTEMPAARAPP